MNRFLRTDVPKGTANNRFGLTKRELPIVKAVVNGVANKEIADACTRMPLSTTSAKFMTKPEFSTRTKLAIFAVKHKLILLN